MEIEGYLSERQRRFYKRREKIRSFEVFDFNYVPERPLMREEVKPVIDALLRYQQTGIANVLLSSYTNIIKDIDDKIASEERRIELVRQRLEEKFARLETLLVQLSEQSDYIESQIDDLPDIGG